MDEQHEITDENTAKDTDAKTVKYTGHAPDKPILKDAKTGKFIAGTGSSGKGGRKKGSKDRVSQQLVDIAQSLMERRGAELLEEVADRAPEQALALITKIIPASELQKLFEEDRAGVKGDQPVQVNIGVVSGPERLSDGRTAQQVEDQQRGLIDRIKPSETAPENVIEGEVAPPWDEPSEPTNQPTRDTQDDLAARAERERIRRQTRL